FLARRLDRRQLHELFKSDATFEAGKACPEAEMGSTTEDNVPNVPPHQTQGGGLRQSRRVPVGPPEKEPYAPPGRDGLTANSPCGPSDPHHTNMAFKPKDL